MTAGVLLALFSPGHAAGQTARGAAAALAAIVVIGVLVEREILVSRHADDDRATTGRLRMIAVPLVVLLGLLIALRLESYV